MSTHKAKSNFEVAKPSVRFECEFGVYKNNSNSSICYTTSKERAEFVAAALDYFENHGAMGEYFKSLKKKKEESS